MGGATSYESEHHYNRTITDENGTVFQGDAELTPIGHAHKTHKASRRPKIGTEPARELDFTKPERAFIKMYARKLSGTKKFVLLLAYLAKGAVKKGVELKVIQRHWNKMTAPNLLGFKFNTFYSNEAKENGWVDTPKQGLYVLSSSWKEVLKA